MEHPGFFENTGPYSIGDICAASGATAAPSSDASRFIADIKPLADAGMDDLSFLSNRKYAPQLKQTRAGACFVSEELAEAAPSSCVPLITSSPYHAFARALALFYPDSLRVPCLGDARVAIDPTAELEEGVIVEPGAMIGPGAQIGGGTRVSAGAIIGRRCTVGRDCLIGPGASVICTLIGDSVILHGGVRLGQDGFGFAMGPQGHLKVPQVGRVIIQDDVEIGANTTIDRGALKDTVIGAGTKIDNLVQIGHNVQMGRNCIIVAHVALAGSTQLGDFVVVGGNASIAGHLTIGSGTQISGGAGVKDSLPPGSRVGGYPARPIREWAREVATLRRMASKGSA